MAETRISLVQRGLEAYGCTVGSLRVLPVCVKFGRISYSHLTISDVLSLGMAGVPHHAHTSGKTSCSRIVNFKFSAPIVVVVLLGLVWYNGFLFLEPSGQVVPVSHASLTITVNEHHHHHHHINKGFNDQVHRGMHIHTLCLPNCFLILRRRATRAS